MPSVAVQGFCGRFSAFILVDPGRPRSTIDFAFTRSHNLPQTLVRRSDSAAVEAFCMGPVSIRSSSGVYQTRHPMAVSVSQRTWDIILGEDWCRATGAVVDSGCVLDPPPSDTVNGIWCGSAECTCSY